MASNNGCSELSRRNVAGHFVAGNVKVWRGHGVSVDLSENAGAEFR